MKDEDTARGTDLQRIVLLYRCLVITAASLRAAVAVLCEHAHKLFKCREDTSGRHKGEMGNCVTSAPLTKQVMGEWTFVMQPE